MVTPTSRGVVLCVVLCAAIGLPGLSRTTDATTVVELSPAAQLAESDAVIRGEVLEQRTFLAQDGMFTDTEVLVTEALEGAAVAGDVVTVRQYGGTLDGITRYLPGDAQLDAGDDVVLFLADREPESGVFFLTALAQSAYTVVATLEDGDVLLERNLGGLTFYDPTTGSLTSAGEPTRISLSSLQRSFSVEVIGQPLDLPATGEVAR